MNARQPRDQENKQALIAIRKLRRQVERLEEGRREPIAIVGLSCRFPGAPDADAYWQLLDRGGDALSEVPASRWDIDAYYDPDPDADGKIYVRRAGFVDNATDFDASFFGISPREAEFMDPQQRLVLEETWHALEDAGIPPGKLEGSRTGVFVGVTFCDYALRVQDSDSDPGPYYITGNTLNPIAGRLAYVLKLNGPALAIDTACSSSLVSLHEACASLRIGETDLALAGGVNMIVSPKSMIATCRARMLSPDGRCKTFDASADGYARGEGCGMVVLKRLGDARRDGDRILALIRGSAVNHDGHSSGLTVPNGPAQERVIAEALQAAGMEARGIDYLEAHGTGTSLGDPIEIQSAAAVLAVDRDKDRPLLVGSAKTNIGHLEAAAGVAGVIKVVLALQHERLPKHLHFKQPNPHIPWDELNVRITAEPEPWSAGERPRVAGVSSFGFSGTNAHIVISEAPVSGEEPAAKPAERGQRLLTLSARGEDALRETGARYLAWLDEHSGADLGDVCHTANTGRGRLRQRAGLVFEDIDELRGQLTALSQNETARGLVVGDGGRSGRKPKTAFLFTGQGSQVPGMGRGLYETEPVFRETLDRCAVAYSALRSDGPGLLEVMFKDAGDGRLDRTANTQPALYALEVSLAALWRSWGVEPDVLLGHSVGEYAAACTAGVFSLEDGLRLIAERGRLMQSLPAGGGMAAVGGKPDIVEKAIEDLPGVCIAAFNGAGTVISGPQDGIETATARLKAEKLRCTVLKTSHAFHSAQMDPILEEFETVAAGTFFEPAKKRVVSNVTGELVAAGQVLDAAYWTRHIRQPVQFSGGVQALRELGCQVLLEVGPHPVLVGMGQRCWGEAGTESGQGEPAWIGSLRRGRDDVRQILEAAAQLYVAGAGPDPARVDGRWLEHRARLSLPGYPFQRKRYWVELPGATPVTAEPDVRDCVYRTVWERKDRPVRGSGEPGQATWLVLSDQAGAGEAVRRLLEERGRTCVCARPESDGLAEAIARANGNDAAPLKHVVHLGGLDCYEADSLDDLRRAQSAGVESVLALVQELIGGNWSGNLWLVTRGVQRVTESDRVAPAQSPVWGLGKVVAIDHPELWGGMIDLAREIDPADAAASIVDAIETADGEDHVALRGGERWVARLDRHEWPDGVSVPVVEEKGVYLVTGGLGGIGLHMAGRLAQLGARHLVLCGRHAPSETALEKISALEAAGCEVQVLTADVSREEDVARLLDEITASVADGLKGIVHAAGVESIVALEYLDRAELDRALAAKVYGAWLLDRLTTERGIELSLFVLTSSTASVWGATSQGAYAAANAFVDALAERRSVDGLSATAINFGPWSGVGMMASATEAGLAWLRNWGVRPMNPAFALDGAMAVAASGMAGAMLADMDWAATSRVLAENGLTRPLLARLLETGTAGRETGSGSGLVDELERIPESDRERRLVQAVKEDVGLVLRIAPEEIEPDTGFFDMGMDSLTAVELRNRLVRRLGRNLPATLVMDRPTVRAVSDYVLGELAGAAAEPARVTGPAPALVPGDPIAIVGLSCRFPGSPDADSYWRLLDSGLDAMREVPPGRWDADAYYDASPDAIGMIYTRLAGFVDGIEDFDPAFFGMSLAEARGADPQQRLLLEQAWQALEDAGISPRQVEGTRTGVFVGITTTDYSMRFTVPGAAPGPYLMTGTALHAAAGRIAYVLGLQGPALAIDTACSSSLVAVHQACASLRSGESDLALAGGVNVIASPMTMIAICAARALSPGGRCKTFDASADGYARGEGCGMVVLKRLNDARRDGDRVLALIRGSAVNQDGHSSGLTVPNGPAQERVITDALARAGVEGREVAYLEAHGTGTTLGDPIEVQAAAAALAAGRDKDDPLLIGSVKTNIGHLESAAGIASLIKVILAMRHERLPRHLNFSEPNPHIPWDELAVRVTVEGEPWPAGERRRLAGVSSFGVSGTNAHVVVEEPPLPTAAETDDPRRPLHHLLTVSARSETALQELAASYGKWFEEHSDADLYDVCHTANNGRGVFEHRAGLVFENPAELRAQLKALAGGKVAKGATTGWVSRAQRAPKVAFLFTGQGSQALGMGRGLYGTEPVFREHLDRCAAAYRELRPDGPGLLEVMFEGAGDGRLDQTANTQPALYALEVSLAALWRSWGVEPDVLLGHSVGEYGAACTAGVFSLEDGLRLIAERGRLMQSLPPGGSMAAIGAEADAVEAAIKDLDGVCVAAYNGGGTVISGPDAGVSAALERIKADGLKCTRLNTSHAFHSALMDPILEEFETFAAGASFGPAQKRLVSNVTGETVGEGELLDAAYWARHIRQPVRFAGGVQALKALGCDVLLEIGPHPVLVGMGQRCWGAGDTESGGREPVWIGSLRRKWEDARQIREALAALYVAGAAIDFGRVEAPWRASRHKLSLPTYPFQRQRCWVELPDAMRKPAGPQLGDCLYRLGWEQKDLPTIATEERPSVAWLIVCDQGGVGAALASELKQRGQRCTCVQAADEDLDKRLSEAIGDGSVPLAHVVHLRSLDRPRADSVDELRQAQSVGVGSVLALVQVLIAANCKGKLWLVTRGVQRVLESDAVEPVQGPVWGMGKAIGMERPELWGGLIDLPAATEVSAAAASLAELIEAGDAEDHLALRDGQRWVARLERMELAMDICPLVPDAESTCLVTGGLGGLGLKIARRFAQSGARHLVLSSRRDPTESAREAIKEIEATGCEVRVIAADVSHESDVARLLDEIRDSDLPPLKGIVHAAGVESGVALEELDPEHLQAVLAAKVFGGWLLDRLTRARQIDLSLFICTSSISSAWGSVMQAAYGAANAFMDALAQARSAAGEAATVVNYGPWADVGMAATNEEALAWLRSRGIRTIDPDLALDGMLALAGGGMTSGVVADVNWSMLRAVAEVQRPRPLLERLGAEQPDEEASQDLEQTVLAREVTDAAPARRIELLGLAIREELAQVAGVPAGEIRDDVGFFDQGMDSLMAVEFRNGLSKRLGHRLPATLVMDQPTVNAVTAYVLQDVLAVTQKAPESRAAAREFAPGEPIAIVGLSCRFPGSPDAESYWRLMDAGQEALREIPPERWDIDAYYDPDPEATGKMYTRRAGFIDGIEDFDCGLFGISPVEAELMDPQQRLLLEQTWQALENAGIPVEDIEGSAAGVFIGITSNDYGMEMQRVMDDPGAYFVTGNTLNAAAGRLAYVFGLQGPAMAIDTACSSSLVAVHQACLSLRHGESDLALAGGVNMVISPRGMLAGCRARMLSPDGRCKTFDAAADGYVRGEGCGVVVLKRLSDAQRDGDRILALISGSAVNQDGRSSGLTVPNGPAQERVIANALSMAGIDARDVQYLEAHGTGTPLGDPIEVQAAAAVLAVDRDRARPLLIGSAKTNIGHLEAAAGVAGLIKVVLALKHERIPRHLNFKQPNPHIAWDELAVRVTAEPEPWSVGEQRRIAGVSSFGFSGTNAHLVVEEAPAPDGNSAADKPSERGQRLLVLSARDSEALRETGERYLAWLEENPGADPGDLCHTANTGRSRMGQRAGLVFATGEELRGQLTALAQGGSSKGLVVGDGNRSGRKPKTAFLFTGQGSQVVGMGRGLYETEPVFREHLDRCAAAYRELRPDGPGLLEVMFEDAGDGRLDQTANTQPALYALEVSLAALWRSWGVEPDVLLGHSVGEYTAACTAGVFSLEDGLRLIAERGRLMQSLPAGGGMAAVGGKPDIVEKAIEDLPGVCIAAFNGAGTVISGPNDGVSAALQRMKADGLKCTRLNTSHAFHSVLMDPILEEFETFAGRASYEPAAKCLVSNVTGEPVAEGRLLDAAYWARHIRQPVRFAGGVQALKELGCDLMLEVGPHPVLVGMGQRCWDAGNQPDAEGPQPVWIGSLRRKREDERQVLEAAAQLYAAGAKVDFRRMDGQWCARRRKLSLPAYPFQRQRCWVELPESTRGPANPKLEDCVYSLAWEQKDVPAGDPAARESGGWLILSDQSGVGESLCRRLEEQGQKCVCVGVDSQGSADRIAAALDAGPEPVRYVVHLGSLDRAQADSVQELQQAQQLGVESVLGLVQTLISAGWQGSLWLVTSGVQRVLESDAAEPAQSPVWGMGKGIAMEHPELWGGLIDLPLRIEASAVVAGLADFIEAGDGEDQAALRGEGRRWVARLERRELPAGERRLQIDPDGTYLVTGGTGGVGLHMARRLVERGARHVVLSSRSAPSAAARNMVEELEGKGCEVRLIRADVSREDGVASLLDEIRDAGLPALTGLIHAAGVESVVPLEELEREELGRVLDAKVYGSWLLDNLTSKRGIELSLFLCTSSVASVWGATAQAAYASANAFLDALAVKRSLQGRPTVAVNYGPWSGVGMMASATGAGLGWLRSWGIRPMSPSFALDGTEALAGAQMVNTVLIDVDWAVARRALAAGQGDRPLLSRLAAGPEPAAPAAGVTAGQQELAAELARSADDERRELLRQIIGEELCRLLPSAPKDLDDEADLFDLGMDSLMAVEFRNRLKRRLPLSSQALHLSVFYEHSRIGRLVTYLLGEIAALSDTDTDRPGSHASQADGHREESGVRRYRSSDKDAVRALFRDVFGDEAARNAMLTWDWKYDGNPFNVSDTPSILLAEKDDRVVGMEGGMATRLKLGEGVFPACWGTDTQIHPEYKGVAGSLADGLEREGTVISLGTPNRRMYELLQRIGPVSDVCRFRNFRGFFNLAPVLGASGLRPAPARLGGLLFLPFRFLARLCRHKPCTRDVQVRRISSFGDEFKAFWQEASGGYPAITVRDAQFLNWRFVDCPNRTYTLREARRGDSLAGYIVVRDEQKGSMKVGLIVDLLARRDDAEALNCLVAAAVQDFEQRGRDMVSCHISTGQQMYAQALKRNGLLFSSLSRVRVTNPRGPMRDRIREAEDWFLTRADSDFDLAATPDEATAGKGTDA